MPVNQGSTIAAIAPLCVELANNETGRQLAGGGAGRKKPVAPVSFVRVSRPARSIAGTAAHGPSRRLSCKLDKMRKNPSIGFERLPFIFAA
jgi:hypothetical protein